jgi:glycosyltransferase involved in cell wall biosynthesis
VNRPRILLLSWAIPPGTNGSAIIVGNLARQFAVDEMVIAGEQPLGAPPLRWPDTLPRIHHLATEWPTTRRGGRFRRRAQLPLMVLRAVRLAHRSRCTAIVTVFPKEEHLLAGYLTSRWLRIPFFPYFHNTYLENRAGLEYRFAKWLQPRVFARAAHVLVMSEGMAQYYRRRYPGVPCSALVHSFDEPVPRYTMPPEPGVTLEMVLSGNINEACREAALRVCEVIARTPKSRLTLLSGTAREHLDRLGLLRPGVGLETVSRDVLVDRLQRADIMVLPHGFSGGLADVEYETIFPTRTIEYLICGRPILAHTPPGCFLTRFLKEHDCALVIDVADGPAIQRGIEELRSNRELRARLVGNALRAAELFQASRVAGRLRELIGS